MPKPDPFEDLLAENHRRMLKEARELAKEPPNFVIAYVLLHHKMRPHPTVVYSDSEYGDGEAISRCVETYQDTGKNLAPGETLSMHLSSFALPQDYMEHALPPPAKGADPEEIILGADNYEDEPANFGLVVVDAKPHPAHGKTLYYDDDDCLESTGEVGAVCYEGLITEPRYWLLPYWILRPATEEEVRAFNKEYGSLRRSDPVKARALSIADHKSAGPKMQRDVDVGDNDDDDDKDA